MSTYNFKIYFAGGDVARGELPGAIAYIALKNRSEQDDEVFVSHDCMGIAELTAEVKRLKRELDELLRDGRRKFLQYDERTHKALARKQSQGG